MTWWIYLLILALWVIVGVAYARSTTEISGNDLPGIKWWMWILIAPAVLFACIYLLFTEVIFKRGRYYR